MSKIIDKILDILTKKTGKIPQALIIIFIFTAIFPNEAIKISNIINIKVQSLLPESFIVTLQKLYLSQSELLTFWAFLLILFMLTVLINCINQMLLGCRCLTITSGGEILFEINSVIFLSILIYNMLYSPGIKIPSDPNTDLYSLAVATSATMFSFIFFITYGSIFGILWQKIDNLHCSSYIKMTLYIFYMLFICYILYIICSTLLY